MRDPVAYNQSGEGEGERTGCKAKGPGEGRFSRSSFSSSSPPVPTPTTAHCPHASPKPPAPHHPRYPDLPAWPREVGYEPAPDPPPPTEDDPLSVQLCGTGIIVYEDQETGQLMIVPTRCKSWGCPSCRIYNQALLKAKAIAGNPERMITLTLRSGSTLRIYLQVDQLRKWFRLLVQWIRRNYGSFEYFAPLELQRNGTPHLHVLCRGTYVSQRRLSAAWLRISGSPIVHIRKIDTVQRGAQEAIKYVTKTAGDLYDALNGRAIVTMSRGWLPADFNDDDDPGAGDPFAAYFPLSFHDAARAVQALGGKLTPVKGNPRCWLPVLPRPPTPSELNYVLEGAPDNLAAFTRYLVCRFTASGSDLLRHAEELTITHRVRMRATSDLVAFARSPATWTELFDRAA